MTHGTHAEGTPIIQMPCAENGSPDYCLECIGNMTIKCAWCGNPITIGRPITLYVPDKDFKVPDYAVRYIEGGVNALVGCFRMTCADGRGLSGHWLPPGKVERCMSPFELCLASVARGDPSAVVVGDTSNYPASVSAHSLKN